jgi:hypothetical protein
MKYPVLCGVATNANPKLPKIQEASEKKKDSYSYNNKGINEFLGWSKK